MIAFILENKGSKQPLKTFVVTVDDVEKVTGLDFFSELPDVIEDKLESKSDINQWDKETSINSSQRNDLALPSKYVASKRSKVFHHVKCVNAKNIAYCDVLFFIYP